MRKLDLRTMVVMLVVFALGYVACLAMPAVQADVDDPVIVDRLVVTDYIEFANGSQITAQGVSLLFQGNMQTGDVLPATHSYHNLGVSDRRWHILTTDIVQFFETVQLGSKVILDSSRNLQNVAIHPNVIGGSGLDVGKLGGYSAEDFVLKNESSQCFKQCPVAELPPSKQ